MAIAASLVDSTGQAPVRRTVPGSKFDNLAEIPLDNNYPTNGYSMATLAALLGWTQITTFMPICLGPSLSNGVAGYSYDKVNNKIKLYTAAGAEVGNGVDVSAFKLYAIIEGY